MTSGPDQVAMMLASVSTIAGASAIEHAGLAQEWLGVGLPVVLAAFAGAAARLSFEDVDGQTRAVVTVIASTACGAYTQPLLMHLLGFPPAVGIAMGFVAGLGAQMVIPALIKAIPALVQRKLSKVIGKAGGGQSK